MEATVALSSSIRFVAIAGLALLAACDRQEERPAPRPVSFNPPGTALAAMPASNVVWYHVEFDSGSNKIGLEGRRTIATAAESMAGNTMTATVIGKTDTVGNDQANLRLSRDRAVAVRQAMMATGKIAPNRIETHWTGERRNDAQPVDNTADSGGRVVDIGIH
jgi:outer membrane protein OmpA-like peptidoglycan-associated protein